MLLLPFGIVIFKMDQFWIFGQFFNEGLIKIGREISTQFNTNNTQTNLKRLS